MLSNIFGGLGSIVAPPPASLAELSALIRGGMHVKALELLESLDITTDDVDKNDSTTGTNVMHSACAMGALDIVVELIGLGADTNAASSHESMRGNRPLHFAALGGHKRVLIVLLRAGADPSLPNHEGEIAYDLAESEAVGEALLIDRDEILKQVMSPMQITRHELALSPTPTGGGLDMDEAALTEVTGENTSKNRKLPVVPKLDLSVLSAQEGGKEVPRGTRNGVEDMSAAAAAGAARRGVTRSKGDDDDYRGLHDTTECGSKEKETKYHVYSNSPRVDYSLRGYGGYQPEAKPVLPLPPPPTSTSLLASQPQSVIDFDREELEAAVLLAATETSAAYLEQDVVYEDRLFMFKACQPVPRDPAQLQKNVDKLTLLLRRRPALLHTRCIELGNLGKDGQTMLHVAASCNNLTMLTLLLETPGATAWVRDLQGRTPLHCAVEAVKADNIDVCRFLRQKMCDERPGHDPVGAAAPVDLAGRTPLGRQNRSKVAAMPSKDLLDVLYRDGDRSVLPKSPVNTRSGHSPWKSNPVPVIKPAQGQNISYAFSEASGWRHYMEDRVLASFPFSDFGAARSGAGIDGSSGNAVGIFGICDGHGGSFVSQYLVDTMPRVAKAAMESLREEHESMSPAAFLETLSPSQLESVLSQSCHALEEELRTLPRLTVDLKAIKGVTINDATGQPLQPKSADSSGSTGLFCIVSSQCYAIANVGDSRAVVAQFAGSGTDEGATGTPLAVSTGVVSSPFGHRFGTNGSGSNSNNASPTRSGDGSSISSDSGDGGVVVFWSSKDHKCNDAQEMKRIEAAGLPVETHSGSGGSQMKIGNETISMSRSFGDFAFKQNQRYPAHLQALSAEPDIKMFVRGDRDAFIVLACDGVFDVMSNEEVVDFLARKLGLLPPLHSDGDVGGGGTSSFSSPLPNRTQCSATQRPVGGFSSHTATSACDALLKECLKRGSTDNMSVVLLLLGSPPIPAAINQNVTEVVLDQEESEVKKQLDF